METRLTEYKEEKPHFVWLALWRLINMTVFRVLPNGFRIMLLRLFGAQIGKQCLIYGSVKVYVPWNLKMGDAVCFGPRAEIYDKDVISIGSGVIVSQDTWLCTASHDISDPRMALKLKPITIGSDVWIAAKASVLPGVEIGDGAVVGACAVVTKDVPPWSVAVGNPAKVVNNRKIED